jgi:hypothetical protein
MYASGIGWSLRGLACFPAFPNLANGQSGWLKWRAVQDDFHPTRFLPAVIAFLCFANESGNALRASRRFCDTSNEAVKTGKNPGNRNPATSAAVLTKRRTMDRVETSEGMHS